MTDASSSSTLHRAFLAFAGVSGLSVNLLIYSGLGATFVAIGVAAYAVPLVVLAATVFSPQVRPRTREAVVAVVYVRRCYEPSSSFT